MVRSLASIPSSVPGILSLMRSLRSSTVPFEASLTENESEVVKPLTRQKRVKRLSGMFVCKDGVLWTKVEADGSPKNKFWSEGCVDSSGDGIEKERRVKSD